MRTGVGIQGQVWRKAVEIAPHDAGIQVDIILRHYAKQYGLVDFPANLEPPFDVLLELLRKKGYLASGDVVRLLGVSHPTARKILVEFRKRLGLTGTGQRSHTKFSWYFVSLSELASFAVEGSTEVRQ